MPKPSWMRELTYWIGNHDGRDRRITIAAIHESVGATDALALAKFCARAGVSYHAAADNEKIVYMVPRSRDAWHLRNGNPRADGLCLCTPVRGYSPDEWLGPQRNKLDIAAWWLSIVCADRGIDLARCNHQNIRDALRGVVAAGGAIEHHDYTLATRDGTHTDPRGWDTRVWDYVLTAARSTGPEEEDIMASIDDLRQVVREEILWAKQPRQGNTQSEGTETTLAQIVRWWDHAQVLDRQQTETSERRILERLDALEAKLSGEGEDEAPKA